ncbi:acylneuraminate cytidylyltransferase family protein [Methanolobus psychrotolerans]|uniref:acylneuraminate cytidylyltransferase family protein n=1 Tax=Methanolobus psychrotolerans TaxID=1874706 RepID=UPI000B9171FE|nr:cytidylyltransferase [Methanolobus psychrotolerans]
MIAALLIGREGSVGFPGKNTYPVLGRPLMEYPLLAATKSRYVDKVFISTDSQKIKDIGLKHGAEIIDRPLELCSSRALGEDAYVHGYQVIRDQEDDDVEIMVLLHCNAATILPQTIDEGIKVLRENPTFDSAVTVSRYNMWSPLRARKIGDDGLLHPFVPFEVFGDPKTLNCDRDSQGDVWFADMSVSIVRPRCLENIKEGLLPQKWMGQSIYPLKQWGGCDVDYEWQIPQVEYWLKKHVFSENSIPY